MLLLFSIWSGLKVCKSCKYIWFSLFFSPAAPRRLQTTHRPETPVSLLENRPFYKCMSSYLHLKSTEPAKSAKIGPRWLGKLPKVDPRSTERRPKVRRWQPSGASGCLGGLSRAPTKCSFFSGEEKCSHFFSPDRGDCRSRKMLQNAPTLAIGGVHTAENAPPKVHKSL